jgi:hypothetical protein
LTPETKKKLKAASLVVAAIISIFLFAALYGVYKRAEAKRRERVKKTLEDKWMAHKDFLGIGTIIGGIIEIAVRNEALKTEIEKSLAEHKNNKGLLVNFAGSRQEYDGVPVMVVIREQAKAL